MRNIVTVLSVAIFFCLFLPALSFGADINGLRPPAPYGVYSTMSANSPERGQAAISGTYETIFNSSFYRFGANIAYGLSDNMELSLSISDQRDGLEDMAFGFKHRFIDEGAHGPSLAYLVTASLATGKEEVSTEGRYGGGLIISQRVGPVYSHLNAVYTMPCDSDFKGEFKLSSGIVFSAAHNIWLLGEIVVKSSHFSENIDEVETRLGYRVRLAENVYADLGLGVDLKQDPVTYRFMASLSFQYPQEQKQIRRIYEDK